MLHSHFSDVSPLVGCVTLDHLTSAFQFFSLPECFPTCKALRCTQTCVWHLLSHLEAHRKINTVTLETFLNVSKVNIGNFWSDFLVSSWIKTIKEVWFRCFTGTTSLLVCWNILVLHGWSRPWMILLFAIFWPQLNSSGPPKVCLLRELLSHVSQLKSLWFETNHISIFKHSC